MQTPFRNKADILPVAIIMLLTILDFYLFFTLDSPLLLVAYFALMIIPKGLICSWNHHHQHTAVFDNKIINRILEFFYALHTGAVTNVWVLHHNLGHHRHYLDQEKDPSRWKKNDGSEMSYWRYSLEVTFTAYYRAWLVGNNHKKQQKEFLMYGIITSLLIIAITIYNPLNSLFLFILPMMVSLFLTSQATYKHHVGLDTKKPHEASYTDINKFWNVLTGNLGYHTAHHVKPNAHWSVLPSVHAEMEDKIPAENIRQNTL
jgi:fatty acid desaturase